MPEQACSIVLSEHGTEGGTQGHITSLAGGTPRGTAGDNSAGPVLRKRIEPDRTFIGSMCVCGQHPRVWTIWQFLKAWQMGRAA
jgi:hypothetical protein